MILAESDFLVPARKAKRVVAFKQLAADLAGSSKRSASLSRRQSLANPASKRRQDLPAVAAFPVGYCEGS